MESTLELSQVERTVLDFERSWWLDEAPRTKAAAIRARLEMSPTRYYGLLERLADSPAAEGYDPLVVRRLRRRRLERRRSMFTGEAPRQTRPR